MSEKKTLLIIGAGIEQIQAYTEAKKLGLNVIGTDINPDAPAFKHADHQIIASTRDPIGTVFKVKQYHEKNRINGVMTVANDVPLTVSKVAEELNLPSVPIELAEIFSNKHKMKKFFNQKNIRTPDFRLAYSKDDVMNAVREWSYPIIIKPIDGRGSRGVILIRNENDLDYYDHSLSTSEKDYLLVEKYISGKQFSSESLIYDGICYTSAISERNYDQLDNLRPFVIENGGVIPANISKNDEDSINNTLEDLASKIGLKNGTIKGDIVMSEDGPLIIEVALRLSGGYFSTEQIPRSRGINLVRQVIKLAIGDTLQKDEIIPKNICSIGIRYFFPEPGKITAIEGYHELEEYDWITKKGLYLDVGDVVPFPENHTVRAGFLHAIGDTIEEAENRAIKASNSVKIRTLPF